MKAIFIKVILAIFVTIVSVESKAQTYGNHIELGVGTLYENGFDATFSIVHETKHHNAWEYFFNAYVKYADDTQAGHITKESFWKNYRTWGGGIVYKPCVNRGKNNYGCLRLGGSIGSDTDEVVGWVNAGYQHNFVLHNGFQLFCQVKTDVAINGLDLFRTGVCMGVSIPLGAR